MIVYDECRMILVVGVGDVGWEALADGKWYDHLTEDSIEALVHIRGTAGKGPVACVRKFKL